MRRKLLALAAIFAVVSVTISTAMAALVVMIVGIGWIVAHDIRRRPWSSQSQRSQDAAYGAAILGAHLSSGQAGADCPVGAGGYDGFGGCDAGGGGGI